MKRNAYIAALFITTMVLNASAEENIGSSGKTAINYKSMAASCSAASSSVELSINNVRTTLLNGGDVWWDLNDARYEIPKVDPPGSSPSIHSLFAGAIWLGGIDAGGQLKIAAQTYRQSGNDFWPGPLDNTANISDATCEQYDRFWRVLGSDIDDLLAAVEDNSGACIGIEQVPQSLREWPANGNFQSVDANGNTLSITNELAPFFDSNNNGIYEPECGDHPAINPDCGNVYADEMLFWVYNDKGNIHSETGGQAIGIQINALAFAFTTSDEVNDMTFYRYKLINKASIDIREFYMAQWVDADLGCFNNDYVGCDTSRSLGICYNGTSVDADCATRGYGSDPPIIGIDYFEGPLSDPIDSLGNRVQLGMSTFTYYNNDFSTTGNPETAVHFYNYMKGFWKDNTPFTSDVCNAFGGTATTSFMFPSDPPDGPFPDFWSECSCNNPPADRRFLQASGPFTLEPGAVNNITVGAVWVRPNSVYPCPSFESTIGPASDKAQALFNNCFKLVDGPDAPTLVVRELDREIIISLKNEASSNNVNESYDQVDPTAALLAKSNSDITDTTYTFQGYQVYQLRDNLVTASELNEVSKARLVSQVDVRDDVDKIVNYEFDAVLGSDVPILRVDGNNQGIKRTLRIVEDLFATGSKSLINHKTYYFAAIAYAYNNYIDYDPLNASNGGQKTSYLQGRKNYQIYSAIPHISDPGLGGTVLNAEYGDGIPVRRIEGKGNGGQNLNLTPESVDNILASADNWYGPIEYEGGRSPIEVRVVDPFALKDADFIFTMLDTSPENIVDPSASWQLEIISPPENGVVGVVNSDRDISKLNEQLIENYGISISLRQVEEVGRGEDHPRGFLEANGFIEGTIDFADNEAQWITGVQDRGTFTATNWIRSGQYRGAADDGFEGFFDDHTYITPFPPPSTRDSVTFWDPSGEFSNVLSGTFSPYCLATNWRNESPDLTWPVPFSYGPAFPWRFRANYSPATNFEEPENNLHILNSVDLVLTSDKSKWTQCVVVETGEDELLNEGGAMKGQIRNSLSLNKEGVVIQGDTGRSWFPGYAINVETGERLNIMFGEDSWLVGQNGRDMLWNPTELETSPLRQVLFGGKHSIYVMKTRYDNGVGTQRFMLDNFNAFDRLTGGSNALLLSYLNDSIYNNIMWVSYPLLAPGFEFLSLEDGLIPNETTVRIRVNTPYQKFSVDNSNNGNPKYFFSTDGIGLDTEVQDVAESACDLIKAVPNPYYAYSAYETSQIDNRIKITNLPDNCTVSIYTLGGVLIRRIERAITSGSSPGAPTSENNFDNTIDWDLKNDKNIPISSGLYLIHVEADGVCEKVIKWFGALRPIDLDTF